MLNCGMCVVTPSLHQSMHLAILLSGIYEVLPLIVSLYLFQSKRAGLLNSTVEKDHVYILIMGVSEWRHAAKLSTMPG